MLELSELRDAIINGDDIGALEITRQSLEEKVDPVELINKWMIPAMEDFVSALENTVSKTGAEISGNILAGVTANRK
jgi:hypothetical protein